MTNQSVHGIPVIFHEVSQFQHSLVLMCHSLLSDVQVYICPDARFFFLRLFVFFLKTCSVLPLRSETNSTGIWKNSHNRSSYTEFPGQRPFCSLSLGNCNNNTISSGQYTCTEYLPSAKYFPYSIVLK